MRSRYAAYALGRVDYVLDTTDPDGPAWEGPPKASLERWHESVTRFCRTTRFAGLEILEAPAPHGGWGTVTFRARLVQGGADASFTERSRFVHRGGNWRYHAGERVKWALTYIASRTHNHTR
jgi:SEC-C motif-containing protein